MQFIANCSASVNHINSSFDTTPAGSSFNTDTEPRFQVNTRPLPGRGHAEYSRSHDLINKEIQRLQATKQKLKDIEAEIANPNIDPQLLTSSKNVINSTPTTQQFKIFQNPNAHQHVEKQHIEQQAQPLNKKNVDPSIKNERICKNGRPSCKNLREVKAARSWQKMCGACKKAPPTTAPKVGGKKLKPSKKIKNTALTIHQKMQSIAAKVATKKAKKLQDAINVNVGNKLRTMFERDSRDDEENNEKE